MPQDAAQFSSGTMRCCGEAGEARFRRVRV